jgi:replication factor A1
MAAADLSDQMWLQGFNDVGKVLFGMTGNELVELRVCLFVYFFLKCHN